MALAVQNIHRSAGFYGDIHGDFWPPDEPFISMPTVIARIYTHDGFVVAADGRKLNGLTRQIASEADQKIFPLLHRDGHLSCAFAGVVQITRDDGSLAFDFVIETLKAAKAITDEKARSLYHYSESLMERISAAFATARHPKFHAPHVRDAQTNLLLDGFFDGRPKRTAITFYHEAEEKGPFISTQELHLGRTIGYGSRIIMAMLSPKLEPQFELKADEFFQSYRRRCQPAHTLSQAIDVALATVEAHCDPVALTLDHEVCEAIGGHIHIATITGREGFKWARAPIDR